MTQPSASGRYEGILHQDILSEGDGSMPSFGIHDGPSSPSGFDRPSAPGGFDGPSPISGFDRPSAPSGFDGRSANVSNAKAFGTNVSGGSASTASKQSSSANGVPTGRYHTVLYDLLTWQRPRASAISMAMLVLPILVGRFVNVLRFVLLGLWTLLSITTGLEWSGRVVLGQEDGFSKGLRPRKYYIVTKDMIDPYFEEIHNLLNFVLIEFQRVLFVENIKITLGALFCSVLAYELVKILPVWALTALAITMAYAVPPIYLQNQEHIDAQLARAQTMADENYEYAKELANKHAGGVVDKANLYFQKSKDTTRANLGLSSSNEKDAFAEKKAFPVEKGAFATNTDPMLDPTLDPMLDPVAVTEPMMERSAPPIYSHTRIDPTTYPDVPKGAPEITVIRDLDAELNTGRGRVNILE